MGLIQLIRVATAAIKTWQNAPGQGVVVTATGLGGATLEAELYAPAGFVSRPPKDARGLFIPIGAGQRYGVVIGGHNYKVTISLADGETQIFSTTADGATVKSTVLLKADGTIEINGNTKKLITDALQGLLTTLCGTLAAHVHTSFGTPSPGLVGLACDITSAKTTTVKTGG